MYVLIKEIGWRLPLQLQCSWSQGQQGDVNLSLCAETTKKNFFEGDKI